MDNELTKEIKVQRYATMAMVLISAFMTSLIGSAMNLAIPNIGQEFGVSASTVGWMVTGYMLTTAALSVPFGRWSDITCRRNVVAIGIVVFLAGCMAATVSVSMAMLLCARIVQAIGGAMILSSNMPILISVYPPNMRGKALGFGIGAVYIGLSMGPVIGGFINHYLGWRCIFVFSGLLSVVSLVLALTKVKKDVYEGPPKKMDIAGSLLFVVFITLFMLGLSKIEMGFIAIAVCLAGVVTGIAFVRFESSRVDPILDLSLFRNNIGYTLSNISALLNYAATFAISYLMAIYLQVVIGLPSQVAGIVMITQPAIMAVLTPKMGKLSDTHSPFVMSSIGMGICGLSTLAFVFINENTPVYLIIFVLAITGVGFALFSSPNTNAVMSFVDKRDYGIANSVLNTMRSIGQTTSMVIVTIIVSVLMPNMQITEAGPEMLVRVINTAFIVFTAMCVCGVFISLKRKRD